EKPYLRELLVGMDYSIRISNLNHSTSHFGSLNSTPALPPNNTGRKRPRSNSMNKSDQTQKTARLLSPPRQRGSSSTSLPSPPLACNEIRLSRSNSLICELSCKTHLLAVQDFEPSDLMDCDNTQFDENLDAEMNQPHETNSTRTQRYCHRQTNKPCVVYTMGRRTDCERCLLRIPGHFAHVINQ
ncbi:1703_t:CDS:2, partial [Cetraspora pellucida]